MKLTVLVDNNTYIDAYYVGEPAVSYYLETEDKRILFDTGYSRVFMDNAKAMGIDLGNLTHIVLSHGHNDHSRGLQFLAEEVDLTSVTLLAHPECFLPKKEGELSIGAPFTEEEVKGIANYVPASSPVELTKNLVYLGQIPRNNGFEAKNPIGHQLKNGCWEEDFVLDDTALAYRTEKGIFIITGCSHSGICNIVEYAKAVCGDDRVIGIIGGFHLFAAGEQLDGTVEYLKACGMDKLYPCHCVSLLAKAKMLQTLPVEEVGVGLTLEIS